MVSDWPKIIELKNDRKGTATTDWGSRTPFVLTTPPRCCLSSTQTFMELHTRTWASSPERQNDAFDKSLKLTS